MISFKPTAATAAFIEKVNRNAKHFVEELQPKLAEIVATEAVKRLKDNILSQHLPNKAKSAKWKEYKAKHGLDTRTLLATHEYVDSLKAVPVGGGRYAIQGKKLDILESKLEHVGPLIREMRAVGINAISAEIVKKVFG